MGLGAISFADLAKAARRSRGMGQVNTGAYTMGGAVPPTSNPCYNPADSFAHFFGAAGADENACLAQNQAGAAIILNPALSTALAPGLPAGYDPSTGTIDSSNTTGATVSQSAAIAAALQAELAAAVAPGGVSVSANDPCTSMIGISCLSLALIAGLIVVGLAFIKGAR
jgi:hypothetical protein